MGGILGLRSEEGKGSTFWFELALPEAPLETPVSSEAATRAMFRHRVLLAEDHPINQIVARQLLASLGVEVTVARNGQEAVDTGAKTRFDLVFMDCQMPLVDGYEATRRLRAAGSPVPIIALTASVAESDYRAALEAGMDGFLSKPFTKSGLEAILTQYPAM